MENVTYPIKETNVAEISVEGINYKFRVPPVIGTHSECFKQLSSDSVIRVAKGTKIAVYAVGALDPDRKNEWLNSELIRFPSKNYLRAPYVLTTVPKRKEFGDLEGGLLVDSDLKGEGIAMNTEVPKDLSGWRVNDSGLFSKDNRVFVPYDKWYKDEWDENNGAAIALFERRGAEMLVRARKDSGRNYVPLWKVDVNSIQNPEKRVPVLVVCGGDGLYLGCSDDGVGRGGCAVGVCDSAVGAAQKI